MKEALATAGLFLVLALVLYFPALSGSWRWDDPQLLLQAVPQISTMPPMPWPNASLKFDLTLFGLNPAFFYFHHLLALAACGLALYACLRLWVKRLPALFGAVLFMVGSPALLASEQLMTRHDIEGLVLVLLALVAFVQARRAQRWQWLAGGALCCALVVISREAYLSLLALLSFTQEGALPGTASPGRLLLPWAAFSVALGFYAGRLAPVTLERGPGWRNAGYAGAVLIVAAALWLGLAQRAASQVVADEYDAQAEFLWTHDNRTAFLPSENVAPNFSFITGMRDLRRALTGQEAARPIVDPLLMDAKIAALFAYDRECRCMRDVTGSIVEMRELLSQTMRSDVALSMEYQYDNGNLEWHFGPYTEGSYTVVSDVLGAMPAPAVGSRHFSVSDGTPFYLRYNSPEGWVTYSALQHIRHGAGMQSWER